jgi:hypothetical protein
LEKLGINVFFELVSGADHKSEDKNRVADANKKATPFADVASI